MIQLDENNFFVLFACCVPVKGASRSTVCDLQRNSFLYIPNELYELLAKKEIQHLKDFEKDTQQEIIDIISYLEEEEYGFYTDTPSNFPPLDFNLDDYPDPIKNSIVDIDENSNHNLSVISKSLSNLLCSAIELRYFCSLSFERLINDLKEFEESSIRTIHLLIAYQEEFSFEAIKDLCTQNKRVKQVVVYSCDFEKVEKIDLQTLVIFTTEIINDEAHCGVISPYYFQTNVDFFRESLSVNNCLNNKISIDKKGFIKNCPSLPTSFGHISTNSLENIITQKEFQKVWTIKKDEINICKDCEFRYICMDCRAYTQDKNSNYAKPLKCKYDPYTATWEK